MIQKKISEEVLVAIQGAVWNSKHINPKSQEHEAEIVSDFIDDFKKELEKQKILRVEVLSQWIKKIYFGVHHLLLQQ